MTNPNTTVTYLTDQIERIKRSKLKKGDNSILDFINDFNLELACPLF